MSASTLLTEELIDFLDRYYREECGHLAANYPHERALWIDYDDLWRFDTQTAEDFIAEPERHLDAFAEALSLMDLPLDVSLENATVRVRNVPDEFSRQVTDLRTDDTLQFRGVEGVIEQVTGAKERVTTLAFKCGGCGNVTRIPQPSPDERAEPTECHACSKRTQFTINYAESDFVDEVRLLLKQPADAAPDGRGDSITAVVRDDLLTIDGRHLQQYAGDRVKANAMVKRKQGGDALRFERFLDVNSVDFLSRQESVDVDAHLTRIKEEAARGDCVERFAESLVPELYATEEWETGLLVAVAYLFGAPRIDLGTVEAVEADMVKRGDIHVAFIGDPGTMKSGVARAIATFSPRAEHRSATGIASEAGITAAAVRDDNFGGGQWTLKPGILVRGNGGHVIMEEVDKTGANLERMNDGLEGAQRITVDKADIHAELDTRVGLLITGNPTDGRFQRELSLAEQVDIDRSLLSRFDAILTLQDHPNEDMDHAIGGKVGESWQEGAEAMFGERTELNHLEREIPAAVGRAWIQHARDTVNPIPTDDAIATLEDWYAEDARTINDDESVVPATPRTMEVGLRFASAFARVRLSDEVTVRDVDLTIAVQKALIGQTYDPETGNFDADRQTGVPQSQNQRVKAMQRVFREADGALTLDDLDDRLNMDRDDVEDTLETIRKHGDAYEPSKGEYRLI